MDGSPGHCQYAERAAATRQNAAKASVHSITSIHTYPSKENMSADITGQGNLAEEPPASLQDGEPYAHVAHTQVEEGNGVTPSPKPGGVAHSASIVAVCNQKGGVGKSTTVYHLARAAATTGRRCLVIDLDPQGNVTSVLSEEELTPEDVSVADVLSSRTSLGLSDVIVTGIWDGLKVAPSVGDVLAAVRDEMVIVGPGHETELRLRKALAKVSRHYDLILIDCPPSLDELTKNALAAANGVLIVSQTKLWSANGIAHLLASIDTVQRHFNPTLAILGVIINLHEAHTNAGRYWSAELQEAGDARGFRIFAPPVPKRAIIADSIETRRGLDELGADGAALAQTYVEYLKEIEGAE